MLVCLSAEAIRKIYQVRLYSAKYDGLAIIGPNQNGAQTPPTRFEIRIRFVLVDLPFSFTNNIAAVFKWQ